MPFNQYRDDELAELAEQRLRGSGHMIEMMRRLKDSLVEQQETTNRLTTRLYWFTIAIFFLGAVQLGLFIYQVLFQKP